MRAVCYDFEDSEILTCHQISLDPQSHYARESVTAEVVLGLEPCHLWDRRGTSASNDSYIAVEKSLHDKASQL